MENIIYSKFKKYIDIVICSLIVVLSFQKGGFYPSDSFLFNVATIFLGIMYIVLSAIDFKKNNRVFKIDKKDLVIYILYIILAVSYFLPVIFKTAANFLDSMYEALRYVNLAILFFAITLSDNKRYYLNTIVIVAFFQALLGLDGLSLRLLESFLNKFSSGYLHGYYDRLSGTIQYANTTAVIFFIAYFILFQKYLNDSISKKSNFYFVLIYVMSSCMILTGTRSILLFMIISNVIYYIKIDNKRKFLVTIIHIVLIDILYTTLTSNYLLKSSPNIYYLFAIFFGISYLLSYVNVYVINFVSNLKLRRRSKKIKYILIFSVIACTIIYCMVAFNFSKPLQISENISTEKVQREIYGLESGENTITLKVGDNSTSEYNIYIYLEDKNFDREFLTKLTSSDLSNMDEFNYTFAKKDNTLRLIIQFEVVSGTLNIDKVFLNGKEKIVQYLMLPSEFVFRIVNLLHGSDSINARIIYIQDAIKIIKLSPIIGVGGNGFSNLYKSVQDIQYTSTQVHNSFLQIFVESGIIGGFSIIAIICITIYISKNNLIKLIYIIYVVHSIAELNFSYMLMLVIFAILTACITKKEK